MFKEVRVLFCSNCGHELKNGETACSNCGKVMVETPVATSRLKSTFGGAKRNTGVGMTPFRETELTPPGACTPPPEEFTPQQPLPKVESPEPAVFESAESGGDSPAAVPELISREYKGPGERAPEKSGGYAFIRIIVAAVLTYCVFFLSIGKKDGLAGKDLLDLGFEILESLFGRLDFLIENLDRDGVLETLLFALFEGFGILMYVFASIGVLGGALMKRKSVGKTFSIIGIFGLVLFFAGMLIETGGETQIFEGVGYGLFVNLGLYITSAVLASKE